MLNDPHSHGLWEASAPQPPATSPLSGDVRADVVIVGAGYTGLSAALHLAEAGVKAIILEANQIGFGGAGRNVGLINAGMWVMPDDLPDVLGPDYGERLLNQLGNGPLLVRELIERHNIACELERSGTLHCAVGSKGLRELEQRAEQWQRRGAPVSLLSAEETAKRIGTRAYAGSMLDMRAGTLQPLAYARGLAHAAVKAGAVIHTGSAVTDAERVGGRWKVKTAQGSVSADWVIVSTDAYSVGPWNRVRGEQVHLPYFNLATHPLTPEQLATILPGREGCWDTKQVLSSFRMDQAGRLVFGSVGALDRTGMAVHSNWAKREMKRLFPQLGDVSFEYEWYGLIGMTDDALPRFHKFAPNVVCFCGYNGRGISPGSVFGKVLAQHVQGQIAEQDLPLPVSQTVTPSFRTVKEMFYQTGSALTHFTGARF